METKWLWRWNKKKRRSEKRIIRKKEDVYHISSKETNLFLFLSHDCYNFRRILSMKVKIYIFVNSSVSYICKTKRNKTKYPLIWFEMKEICVEYNFIVDIFLFLFFSIMSIEKRFHITHQYASDFHAIKYWNTKLYTEFCLRINCCSKIMSFKFYKR